MAGLASVGLLVSRAVYPVLSRVARERPDEADAVLRPAARLLFALSMPAAAGGALVAPQIVGLLYPAEYAPAAGVLRVLVWTVPLAFASATCQYALLAFGRPAMRAVALAVQLAIEVAAALALVPRYGLIGAAAAHLLGHTIGLAASWLALVRVARVTVLRYALAAVAASAAMALALVPVRDLGLALVLPMAAAVYAAALFAFGGMPARGLLSLLHDRAAQT